VPPAVGLEIRDASAVALLIDDQGVICGRGDMAAGGGVIAAVQAVELATAKSHKPAKLGIAAPHPDAPAVTSTVDEVAASFPALLRPHPVVGSGTAVAMAEAWVGAARGASDVVYFGVTEHATAGILRDGLPVTGAHGRAPAVAWLSLNPVDRDDYRRTGCLDVEVSAAGIVRRLVWRIKAGDASRVRDMVSGDLAAITVDQILAAARDRDGVSSSVMRDTARYLGMAAANLVSIVDPEVLVLGGIMASAADLLLEPLRIELTRRLAAPMADALTIRTASLGADAAALGAARRALISD
jgi:glucokinase